MLSFLCDFYEGVWWGLKEHYRYRSRCVAGVTCYTCVNVSDNLVCNQFAIDRPCPQGKGQNEPPTAQGQKHPWHHWLSQQLGFVPGLWKNQHLYRVDWSNYRKSCPRHIHLRCLINHTHTALFSPQKFPASSSRFHCLACRLNMFPISDVNNFVRASYNPIGNIFAQ